GRIENTSKAVLSRTTVTVGFPFPLSGCPRPRRRRALPGPSQLTPVAIGCRGRAAGIKCPGTISPGRESADALDHCSSYLPVDPPRRPDRPGKAGRDALGASLQGQEGVHPRTLPSPLRAVGLQLRP